MILYSDWRLVHFIKKKKVCVAHVTLWGSHCMGKNQRVSPVWCLFTANGYDVTTAAVFTVAQSVETQLNLKLFL